MQRTATAGASPPGRHGTRCAGAEPRRRAAARLTLAGVGVLAVAGGVCCERCNRADQAPATETRDGAAPGAPVTAAIAPAAGWPWHEVAGRPPLALPPGCRYRGRPLQAELDATTRWTATPGQLGTLLVATTDVATADADAPWRATRAGAIRWRHDDPAPRAPTIEPVPWLGCADCRAAYDSAHGGWLLGHSEVGSGGARRARLWRDSRAERIAESDALRVVDVTCNAAGTCAVLTTKVAKVARPGADLWVGAGAHALQAWQHFSIEPDWAEAAYPVSVGLAPDGGQPTVTLLTETTVHFVVPAANGDVESIGTLAAPHGLVEAATGPELAALTWRAERDTECGRGDAGVAFQHKGGQRHPLATRLAPLSGQLQPLTGGFWLDVLVPLRCAQPERVVYGALASATGDEPPRLLALAEADDVVVTTLGNDVDIWLRRGRIATWVRATCEVERAGPEAGNAGGPGRPEAPKP